MGRSSSPGRVKNFLFSTSSRPTLGSTQPPIQWVPGALSLEVKQSGLEAEHSPPTSAEVKKMRIYTSTPPYVFTTWCLTKPRCNFIVAPCIYLFISASFNDAVSKPLSGYTVIAPTDMVI
jgi:hypothetical protein